jgi:hypothetical protein
LRKELLHRAAPKLAPQYNASRRINAVNLEYVLRQIQTNHANLAHGRLPCLVESTSPVWHTDAVGAVHTIIASEAKQSSLSLRHRKLDCFVAEPVIGRAFARPVGSSQ